MRVGIAAGLAGALGHPHANNGLGSGGQRNGPVLAAFADASDIRAGTESDICADQGGQLGETKTSLECHQQQRAIAATFPSGPIGCGDQGVDLCSGEERYELLVEPLGGDGKNSLDQLGVLGVSQCRVGEQRSDRGQSQVARSRAVVTVGFEVIEKRADRLGVEVVPTQVAGLRAGCLLHEHEQQLERIPIGGDRARADPALFGQAVGEEALQGGGDWTHRPITSRDSSSRAAANASSSGCAEKYQ